MLDKNEELLNEVYKNTKMGGDSIIDLLDKVTDNGLRSEMIRRAVRLPPLREGGVRKARRARTQTERTADDRENGREDGYGVNTMLDTTTSHLAEMMINGATMGIIDLEKKLNDGDGGGEAERLARDVLRYEKETVERLGQYL